jgi:hypothetical protein
MTSLLLFLGYVTASGIVVSVSWLVLFAIMDHFRVRRDRRLTPRLGAALHFHDGRMTYLAAESPDDAIRKLLAARPSPTSERAR